MVELTYNLDAVFGSLSDPVRRDMLRRVSECAMSIGAIAEHYRMSFAGVSKHLKVMENAGLVRKTRQGKEQIVSINPQALAVADAYLEEYRQLWERRLDSLDSFLQSTNKKGQ